MSVHFGVAPREYAMLFALNAISLVGMSQLNGWLTARFGLARSVRMAVTAHVVTMLLLLALTAAGLARLEVMVVLLMIGYGLNGIIVPSTFVLAMQGHGALGGRLPACLGDAARVSRPGVNK